MHTLNSIISTIHEHLKTLKLLKTRRIFINSITSQDIRGYIYNYIIDIGTSRDNICALLENLRQLDGSYKISGFRDLLSVIYLDGLAVREPEPLESDWGELFAYLVVRMSWIDYEDLIEYDSNGIISLSNMMKCISQYSSPQLCPNPFIRIAIFKYMSHHTTGHTDNSKEYFIETLFQLNDNFSDFQKCHIREFSPVDLVDLIKDHSLEVGNILKSNYTEAKQMKIIESVVKITRMFLCMDHGITDQWELGCYVIESFWHFCGLVPVFHLNRFASVVCRNAILHGYVVEVLDLVSNYYSNMYPEHLREAITKRNTIISTLVATEICRLSSGIPQHLHHRELNGITPKAVHHMLFFTSNNRKI